MAERDPDIIRHMPFLSRNRRKALSRIQTIINADMARKRSRFGPENLPVLGHVFREYSSRTLHLIADSFADVDVEHAGIVSFFIMEKGRLPVGNEMHLRAIMSYRDVLEAAINDAVLGGGYLPRSLRVALEQVISESASYHTDFLRHEDLSVLEGETRARYEAVLTVMCGTSVQESSFTKRGKMQHGFVSLVMSRPDRAHDIVAYRNERGVALGDLDAEAVAEYLDNPSPALSVGTL